jgi:hypothetical protein
VKLPLRRTAALSRQAFLAAFPHGGQRVSRRNAWAGMSDSAARLRAHREAQLAVRVAELGDQPVSTRAR